MDKLRGPNGTETSSCDARRPRTLRERWTQFVSDACAAWRELRYANQAGKRALACYQRLQISQPELSGAALYIAVVCDYSAVDIAVARTILHRAEASFSAWPNERELIFRDVVQYVVILDYLASHAKRNGTTANMMSVL